MKNFILSVCLFAGTAFTFAGTKHEIEKETTITKEKQELTFKKVKINFEDWHCIEVSYSCGGSATICWEGTISDEKLKKAISEMQPWTCQ